MPLDKDNPSHRDSSDKFDAKFSGNAAYDKVVRPIVHGAYHAGRYATGGRNPEEKARAMDQFSKVGTGQTQTEYLKAHREQNKK